MKSWPLDGETRTKVLDALRRSVWFKSLEAAQLETVLGMGKLLGFEQGETILRQGDAADAFYLMVSGVARIEIQSGDESTELGQLRAPFSFGDLGVLLEQPRSATVVAREAVVVLAFEAATLPRMLETLPGFALSLAKAMAVRLAKVSEMVLPEHPAEKPPEPGALNILPRPFMERHRILPLELEDNRLTVGFIDNVTPEILAFLRESVLGAEVVPVSITPQFFDEVMRTWGGVAEWSGRAGEDEAAAPAMEGDTGRQVAPALARLLERMVAEGASDLHLASGRKPHWRLDGEIHALEDLPELGPTEVPELMEPVLHEAEREQLELDQDVELGYSHPGLGRFRVDLFHSLRGVNAVFRPIPNHVASPAQLGLPKVVTTLCDQPHGLILVTGSTGSGKTATLAALVDHLNRTRRCHILTLEDPVEYVHEDRNALIDQRQVGRHVRSFARGLQAGLREDPDVILVGAIHDPETMDLVLRAASSGHLVLATLHTTSVVRSLDLVSEMFPGDEQVQARHTLADVLRGVITQRLLKKRGGGRVPAVEVLVVNQAIAHLIREGRATQVVSMMQTTRQEGNQLFNDSLAELVKNKVVTLAEAQAAAIDKKDLAKRLGQTAPG